MALQISLPMFKSCCLSFNRYKLIIWKNLKRCLKLNGILIKWKYSNTIALSVLTNYDFIV